MKLNNEEFSRVIDATPLVSIDLIIRNEHGEVLLGFRRNRPALNYWFVPGGRIRKNEKSQDALNRIALAELGTVVGPGQLLGIFDHFYDDNFFGLPDLNTHYVALAYQCEISRDIRLIQDEQHAEFKWWDLEALLASTEVHENTKMYFRKATDNGFRCR
jgi:colanic acid biosynthesis protein WcaH